MDAIRFLRGEIRDPFGRNVWDIMHFTPNEWESCHSVIQWVFPTRTQSKFNPAAPVIPVDYILSKEEIEDGQHVVNQLLYRFLSRYGVNWDDVTGKFYVENESVTARTFRSDNHNMLRITRIIECLGIFQLYLVREQLINFLLYDIAIRYKHQLTSETVAYWVAAWENKQHLINR
jgi:hypothetical protein